MEATLQKILDLRMPRESLDECLVQYKHILGFE